MVFLLHAASPATSIALGNKHMPAKGEELELYPRAYGAIAGFTAGLSMTCLDFCFSPMT